METISNIKKVSLVFFIITGIIHLSSSILISNKLFLKQAFILSKTMDVPFILTGVIYGLSSLRIMMTNPGKKHIILDIGLIFITVLVLIGLILINFLFPNITPVK